MIKDYAEAKRICDRLEQDGKSWHKRLDDWRDVRDRRMDTQLNAFKGMLPESLQVHFVPYQTPEIEYEIQSLKAILASNEPEAEVLSLVSNQKAIKLAQAAEGGFEAIYAALNTPQHRMDRYDAMLGDGICIEAIDKLGPGEALADYADRGALEEKTDADEGTPAAKYQAEYAKTGNHDEAYSNVTKQAQQDEGLRWRRRILDCATFTAFIDDDGIAEGMERAEVALSPLVDSLAAYGVKVQGERVVVSKTGDSALGRDRSVSMASGALEIGQQNRVKYTQLRTREQIIILIEGLQAQGQGDGEGIFISQPNPFPKSRKTTGYYLTPGSTKMRGAALDRYEPVVLPLIVEAQQLNIARSVKNALMYAEAARDPYQPEVPGKVQPLEPTQSARSQPATDGVTPVRTRGEIMRVPSTDLDLAKSSAEIVQAMEMYRSRDFFSGTGEAGESGLHLARKQTAQLTKLVPIQTNCAFTDRQWLLDIAACVAETGEPVYVNSLPSTPKSQRGDGVQVAESRELTQEMARASIELRITIGADTPESTYAMQQVSREEVTFGTYGMTTHREKINLRNPNEEVRRMAVDTLVRAVLGTDQQPGVVIMQFIQALNQRAQQVAESLIPIAPVAPPPVEMGPDGQPVQDNPMTPQQPVSLAPATAGGQPMTGNPTQTAPQPAGSPVAPGAGAVT